MFPKVIKVATFQYPGAVELCSSEKNRTRICGGVVGNLFNILSTFMRFHYEVLVPNPPVHGLLDNHGNWTGAIGMVYRGETDVAVAPFRLTEQRASAVKFSYPFIAGDIIFATKTPGLRAKYMPFVYPFQPIVWISLAVTLALMPLFAKRILGVKYTLQHLFFKLLGSLLAQSLGIDVSSSCKRILLTAWFLSTTVLFYSYSNVLLSFLIVPLREPGVRNIEELAEAVSKADYVTYVKNGSSIPEMLRDSPVEHFRNLWSQIDKHGWTHTALDNICDRILREKTAVVDTRIYVEIMCGKNNPNIRISDDSFDIEYVAFILNKQSHYVPQISKYINRMVAASIPLKLSNDEVFLHNKHSSTFESDIPKSLRIEDLCGAFIFLLLGYAVSLVIFFVEIMYRRYFL